MAHAQASEQHPFRRFLKDHWGCVIITLFAAILRFWGLDNKGFWYDEFCFWDHFSSGELLTTLQRVPVAHSPGLALLMLPLKKVLPLMDDYSVRVVPALLGVLGVTLTYFLTRRLFNTRTALVAAMLLTVSPIHYQYSRQLEPYTLLVCNVLGGVYASYMAWTTQRRGWWWASGIFVVLTLYSHPFGVFALGMVTAGLAFYHIAANRTIRGLAPAVVIWILGVLAYVPWAAYGIHNGRYLSVSHDALKSAAPESLGAYDLFRQVFALVWQEDGSTGTLIPSAGVLAVIVFASLSSLRQKPRATMMLLSWGLAPILIHVVCVKWGYPTMAGISSRRYRRM